LEHRRKRAARNRTRSLDKKVVAKNSAALPVSLPNIAELITYGEITLGVLRPIGCVATATDDITVWPCWFAAGARLWPNY
jgi:hypothetical protein